MHNVAIAAPHAGAYSETFIAMQIDRLPCALRLHGAPVASETVPGGRVRAFGSARGLMAAAWPFRAGRAALAEAQTIEVARRLRRYRIDRVLANFGPLGVALLPACRRASVPLVVHFHGYDAHLREVTDRHREAYERLGREASAVVAVSRGMVDALVEMGIPSEKIHLTRCGVSPEVFPVKSSFPNVPLFFGVGRFVEKKAPHLTVLAFSKALPRLPAGAKLVLGGAGELLEATRNLALALRLGEAVEFPGILRHEAVVDWMQRATAYVQHSVEPLTGPSAGDREGTPVAVLEAMMSGLPVVSTRHAGIGEVVDHGRTGLLVEERDVDAMAEALVELGNAPERARELGRAAREAALSSYTADHYLAALQRALSIRPA